jgi:uncharacterized protein (TIGR00375 family)
MDIFNADLHIHSPHSIAVSKSLNLDTMLETCKKKGLNILGTGDILQPEWLQYMESNLKKENDGSFSYKDVFFILQTEIEDIESIHHVVLFPDFNSVKEIQNKLKSYSKNILDEWGGRPRVNLPPPELVDIISDSGGIIGPAHAFTPFKAIFRQGKFETIKGCYQDAASKVYFLELGLSANTDLADRLGSLKNVSFLSNSDAHSQNPRSLGREFNKLDLDNPSFEELLLALMRKDDRKIILNVGLNPKLGKYYNMFCNKCRRRVVFKQSKKSGSSIFSRYAKSENFVIYYSDDPDMARKQYIDQVAKNKMICPACKEEKNKNFKVKLGVSERIEKISTEKEQIHPNHRPKYIDAIPLVDIIQSVKRIKSSASKMVLNTYNKMIQELGKEFEILINAPIREIENFDPTIASVIDGFRNNKIKYIPGGGGTYGQINFNI